MTPRPSHHKPPAWTSRSAAICVPQRRNDVNLEILDDEGILVAPDGGVHRLNSTALLVWEFCNGRTTTLQIADRLSRVYRIDADTALDHVEETVAAFAQLDLFSKADVEDEAAPETPLDPSSPGGIES